MKTLFLGGFASRVAPRILAKATVPLDTAILPDEGDTPRLAAPDPAGRARPHRRGGAFEPDPK